MGFLDAISGNAAEVDNKQIQKDLAAVLIDGETVERGFKVVRDMFVFTNKRLILIDRQGISGNKVEYHSIPYDSISQFAVETAGSFDRDAELKLWVRGSSVIQRQLKKGVDIVDIQRTLAYYVLR